ncbi:hypothetical protein BC834DRAFT_844907 [Gloeopeniophorella convolvens]|nr:hypothetical protein BC834DRAFT_844907 [Gloeopeniophorella convolvens]
MDQRFPARFWDICIELAALWEWIAALSGEITLIKTNVPKGTRIYLSAGPRLALFKPIAVQSNVGAAGAINKRSTPAFQGSVHSSAEPNTRAAAASYGAGLEHGSREIISSHMAPIRGAKAAAMKERPRVAGSPSVMSDEQPVGEQPKRLIRKRKGGVVDADWDAGDGIPKTIALKSSQKMFGEQRCLLYAAPRTYHQADLEDQAIIELTSASEDALSDARAGANKMRATNALTEIEESMGQGNASGGGFGATGEEYAANLKKGKGRASPTQSQRGPSSMVESGREESADKDGDYGDIYLGNQLGDPKLYLQYDGFEAYGSGDGSGEGDDACCPDGEGAGLVGPAAEPPVETVANQEPEVNNGAAQEEEALANDVRPEKPAYRNKAAPKPSKRQEQPDIAMVQESAARADGNNSDGGDEGNEGNAEPGPPRGRRQDAPHARSAAGLSHGPHQRDARESVHRHRAGNRPSPRLPSSSSQCRPKAIKARQLAGAKAARAKHLRSGSPTQREPLSIRKEHAAISADRASHGHVSSAAPGSSGGGSQEVDLVPPPCGQVPPPPQPSSPISHSDTSSQCCICLHAHVSAFITGLRGQHVVAGRCWALGDRTAGGPSARPVPPACACLLIGNAVWTHQTIPLGLPRALRFLPRKGASATDNAWIICHDARIDFLRRGATSVGAQENTKVCLKTQEGLKWIAQRCKYFFNYSNVI